MEKLTLKIKPLRPDAVVPAYATAGSAALDLRYCGDGIITVPVGEIRSVPTGLAIAAPEGTAAIVCARSGLAFKRGICLANGIGVVDSDYRGEVCVGIKNDGRDDFVIEPGDRIAQLMLIPVYAAELLVTDELEKTDRGEGGFGSTGVK